MELTSKKCNRCKADKPLADFHKGDCSHGRQPRCKECQKAATYEWREKNPARFAAHGKASRERHRDKRNAACRADYVRNRDKRIAGQKAYARALKDRAYAAYGGYVCACCGETEISFLSIDHINNDGHEHRKTVKGSAILHWLRDNNYPSGFQILCMNCQFGRKHNNGTCPHQSNRLVCEAA